MVPEIMERVNRFGYRSCREVAIRAGEVAQREPERRPPPANLRPIQPISVIRCAMAIRQRAVLEAMAQGLANTAPVGRSADIHTIRLISCI